MSHKEEIVNRTPTLTARQQALLEKLLKGNLTPETQPSKIPKRQFFSPAPLSYGQQRLWVLDRLVPGNPFYNLPTALRITGRLEVGVLERAVNEVIRRHEALRTRFDMDSERDEPRQYILEELKIEVKTIDLRGNPHREQEEETRRLIELEASQPFDLSRGPLLRVTLLDRDSDDHVLLVTLHHIIADAWSVDIFSRELALIYGYFSEGKASPHPLPVLQYPDYALWQRQLLKGDILEKQLAYWKEVLSGELPILELPADSQRPAVPTYRGGNQTLEIPETLANKLQHLSRQENCSLFMTLLAAFNVLLYRVCHQDDILVGFPIANRNRLEFEEMIGYFANTLVFRTDLAGHPTFYQLLARIRRVTSGAYDNQDLPFEKLVEEFQPERYMSHTPFFQVMFNYKAPGAENKDQGDSSPLELSPLSLHNKTSKFDLWLSMSPRKNKLEGEIEYNTDIFAHETITRMIAYFQTLLEEIAADPARTITGLHMIPKEEKQRILEEWNSTHREYDLVCLHHAFSDQAAKSPGHIAAVSETNGAYISYRQLDIKAERLAAYLNEQGIAADMPVGVCLERSLELIIALLGILKANGAYLPIDPEYPQERIDFLLKDSGADILLSGSEITNFSSPRAFKNCPKGTPSHLHLSPAPATSLAYIIYTSGSTGKPKGVMISHAGISNRLQWMQETYGLTPTDRILQKTPYTFDVSVWEFFWPLLTGAVLVMAKPGGHKDSAYLVDAIAREKITTIHFVPTMLNVFLEEPALFRVISLKRVICSGEVLPVEYRDRFFAGIPGVELHNLYGPTEASVDVTAWACRPHAKLHNIPIGQPAANTRIYILDRHYNPVPIGVHGELHIAGVQLARGYLNKPELTAEKFDHNLPDYQDYRDKNKSFCGGPGGNFYKMSPPAVGDTIYKTGDLARWRPDGNIEFLGRLDFQVKVKGVRIEPGEIETHLRMHPSVRDAVVLTGENIDGTKAMNLTAYIVPAGELGTGEDLSDELVTDWQGVFDDTYSADRAGQDSTFNISGWNSSYTGQPLPAEEMRLWVDNTVERLLALKPSHVMEIGCGTGLFLFRLIPHCQRYLGTDISQRGLDYIREQLEIRENQGQESSARVELLRRGAENFDGTADNELDLVIINSVVQYFPSPEYLLEVLEAAVAKIKPGGHLFIGDLRLLPLLKVFHASVEFYKSGEADQRDQVRQRMVNRLALEQELLIDPGFFPWLQTRMPRIKKVELLLKKGRCGNELFRFRCDALLHIDDRDYTPIQPHLLLDWKQLTTGTNAVTGMNGLNRVRQVLEENKAEQVIIAVTGIPNNRIAADLQVLKWLTGKAAPATVGEYRETFTQNEATGVDPEDLYDLGRELPFHVSLTLSTTGPAETYRAIFAPRDLPIPGKTFLALDSGETKPGGSFTNNPLLVKMSAKLVPVLRGMLKDRLPAYMVPAHFVLIERLPLTASGKLDRKALPAPLHLELDKDNGFIAPETPDEKLLAAIWSVLLNLEKVGVGNNFFELGGDSVKAIQVVSRANKQGMQLSVQHLYQDQTIAELARTAEKIRRQHKPAGKETGAEPVLNMGLDREAVQALLSPGIEIEDILPVTPLQRHMLEYLENSGDPDPGLFLIQKLFLPKPVNIDPALLKEVLAEVTAHRPLLRSVFVRGEAEEPVQVICKTGEIPLIYEDLRHLAPDEQDKRLKEILRRQWRQGYDRTDPTTFRMGVIKRGDNLSQYFFTSDYVRFDGWSSVIIQFEILSSYMARAMGRTFNFITEDHYTYYLAFLRQQDQEAAERYWRTAFTGYRHKSLLIPRFRANCREMGEGFARQLIYYSPETTMKIDLFLQKHRLVYATLIYAVWGMLMGSYAGETDVVFGVIYSGRTIAASAGIESMVGSSINVLPVRVKIDPDKTMISWLKHIFREQAEANRYEYTPLEKIKEWCGIPPDTPMFDSYIVMQNLPTANLEDTIDDKQYLEILKSQGLGKKVKGTGYIPEDQKDTHLFYAEMEYPLRVDIDLLRQLCPVFNYFRRQLCDSVVKGYMENMEMLIESIVEKPYRTIGHFMKQIDPLKYPEPENFQETDYI